MQGLIITQPEDYRIYIFVYYDEKDFLIGKKRIEWLTYDIRQAAILHRALLAQDINS